MKTGNLDGITNIQTRDNMEKSVCKFTRSAIEPGTSQIPENRPVSHSNKEVVKIKYM